MSSYDLFAQAPTSVPAARSAAVDAPAAPQPPAVPAAVRETVDRLRRQLQEANDAYYGDSESALSDAAYDALFQQLQDLEAAYPALVVPTSPTHVVGASGQASLFPKASHLARMGSLDNAFTHDALIERFESEGRQTLGLATANAVGPFLAELKIDGVSIALTYEHGRLVRAVTRGDGVTGDVITANAGVIPEIPQTLSDRGGATGALPWPAVFEVRGEVYMTRDGFAALNAARRAAGEPEFKTPRNAAAGSLRQLDPTITASRPLHFFAYAAVLPEGVADPFASQEALLEAFDAWGLPTCPVRSRCATLADVAHAVDAFAAQRATLPYDIDGVVIKVNDRARQRAMGSVGRVPRWALARKWPAEVVRTHLDTIDWQVGRTGVQKPVARLAPVLCGGVEVRNATLHNADYIQTLDVRPGDTVELTRAGEVIPQVIGVILAARPATSAPYVPPSTCASCGAPTVRDLDAADRYCENVACPAQTVRRLEHWASRGALDIRGLGGEICAQLAATGLVSTVADLYRLTPEMVARLDGFAEVSATKLVATIAASRTAPIDRVLIGLGVRAVGPTMSEALIDAFGSLEALATAAEDALLAVPGVGPERARQLRDFFARESTQALLDALRAAGMTLTPRPPRAAGAAGPLAGRTVVVTGAVPGYTRESIESALKMAGAKVTGSVSKKTDFLVAGEDAGSKLEKARMCGVPVVTATDLPGLLRDGTPGA